MLPPIRKLYDNPEQVHDEVFHRLVEGSAFRLEQIVSHGVHSPPGFWYDQDRAEWVVLLRGTATLEFEEGELELRAGDALLIPAHLRHRVARTSADANWLALHYDNNPL